MTAKNTILLIIKQNQGIEYNSLLGKVSQNYSNVNSARAALSRALKDLSIFGFVTKQNNSFYITDKAESMLGSEMKNKLVLKLNQQVRSSRQSSIESIVETLSTLIERSKHDENLLKAAKTSSDFFISDLENLQADAKKKISQLQYLERVLFEQINYLKETNFNDVKKTSFANAKETIQSVCIQQNISEIALEVYQGKLREILSAALPLKFRENSSSLKKENMADFFSALEKESFGTGDVVLFLPPIKAKIGLAECYFIGPFSSISSL